MTNITIDKLFPVTNTTVNTGFAALELSGMFLTTNDLIPINSTGIAQSFTSLEEVGDYFGVSSSEYTVATNYFDSYVGSPKIPSRIWFAKRVNAIESAYIQGGANPVLATIQAITSGAITFNFNGSTQALTALNFSSDTSFSQVASRIQTALALQIATATVTYSSINNTFTASDGATTGTSTIDYSAATPLSTALKMTQAAGAVLSQGSPVLSVAANMTLITAVTKNWFGLSTVYDACSTSPYTEGLALAAWVSSQNYSYIYFGWSQEANLLVPGNTSTIMTAINTAQYANVAIIYGTVQYAAFFAGIGASIDYDRLDGTISFASKTQAGLAPSIDTDAEYDSLIEKGVNFYGVFGANSTEYTFTENGAMTGQYLWIDNAYNEGWLKRYVQNSVAVFFAASGKVPNNSFGYNSLKQVLNTAMRRSVFNGVSEAGNSFDGTTTNILKQQAGYDITPGLTANGYVIQIIPVTSSQRATRTPPVTNIWYSNGGSINRLPINITYVF